VRLAGYLFLPGKLTISLLRAETWFTLSRYVNRTIDTAENSHAVYEVPVHDLKVGAWRAISAWRIVGPFLYKNSELYVRLILF
jgi:hypothetical protein